MERSTYCVPQSAFFEEGLDLDDRRSSAVFLESWKNIQQEHNLSGVTIANLAASFPLNLTQAAFDREDWDMSFEHANGQAGDKNSIDRRAASNIALICAAVLSLMLSVLARSAADYEQCPFDTSGDMHQFTPQPPGFSVLDYSRWAHQL